MELLEAVKFVLMRNKKHMHFKELAKAINAEKLVERGAQTVETMINAKVALDIKKSEKSKTPPVFVKLHNGLIGLTTYEEPKPPAPEPEAAPAHVATHEAAEARPAVRFDPMLMLDLVNANYDETRARFIERLSRMNFLVFERIVENLLRELAFIKYTIVNRRTDGGIDYALNFTMFESNVNMLVAVRRWPPSRKITAANVDEVIGAMETHGFNAGAIINFSDYEPEAVERVKTAPRPMLLLNSLHLTELLMRFGVGVAINYVETLEVDEEYIRGVEGEISHRIDKHRRNGGDSGRSHGGGHQRHHDAPRHHQPGAEAHDAAPRGPEHGDQPRQERPEGVRAEQSRPDGQRSEQHRPDNNRRNRKYDHRNKNRNSGGHPKGPRNQ